MDVFRSKLDKGKKSGENVDKNWTVCRCSAILMLDYI